MSMPTNYEKVLATRLREGLALLRSGGATLDEIDTYLADNFADFRATFTPHGKRKDLMRVLSAEAQETGEVPAFLKPWRKAHKHILAGHKAKARAVLKAGLKPEQILPHSKLVIEVMLALLEEDDSHQSLRERISTP